MSLLYHMLYMYHLILTEENDSLLSFVIYTFGLKERKNNEGRLVDNRFVLP